MQAILIAHRNSNISSRIRRLEQYCQEHSFVVSEIYILDESTRQSDIVTIITDIIRRQEKIIICCNYINDISFSLWDEYAVMLYGQAIVNEIEIHFVNDAEILAQHRCEVEKFQIGLRLGLAPYFAKLVTENEKELLTVDTIA